MKSLDELFGYIDFCGDTTKKRSSSRRSSSLCKAKNPYFKAFSESFVTN